MQILFLVAAVSAVTALLTIYGSHLIATERTRRRGWILVALAVLLLIGREGWAMFSADQTTRQQLEGIEKVQSAVTGVEELGRRHEEALLESLGKAEKTAKAMENVQSALKTNLELSAANLETTSRTGLFSQEMQLLVQQYLAETETSLEQMRGLDAEFRAGLTSKQVTVEAITAGINNEVRGNSVPTFHRKELLEVARKIKHEFITNVNWDALEQQCPKGEAFQGFRRSIEELRGPLDKAIEALSHESLNAVSVKVQAHELQQWLLAYERVWRRFHSEEMRTVYALRADMLKGMKKMLHNHREKSAPPSGR